MSEKPHVPPGMIAVSLSKQTVLLLSFQEYQRGLKAGKRWRRALALAKRGATAPTGPPEAREATP